MYQTVPHCLAKDKKFGEEENLEPKAALRAWGNDFLPTSLSGFMADFPAHWNGLGPVPLPLISPDWLCSALLKSVYSLLLRLEWPGSLADCWRLTNFLC